MVIRRLSEVIFMYSSGITKCRNTITKNKCLIFRQIQAHFMSNIICMYKCVCFSEQLLVKSHLGKFKSGIQHVVQIFSTVFSVFQ